MKYLKLFQDAAQYEQFMSGSDFILPNVSYVEGDNAIHYHPVPPPGAGAIVYKSGSDLLTVDYTLWDASMGTPVGVLVIPEGFAPDGKARMLSLNWASSSSTSSTSASYMKWSNGQVDTSLTNHTKVPTTDNASSTTTGSDVDGYLPSDIFTGSTSYVDPLARYRGTSYTPYIPSPYLGDKPNPAYYAAISGHNNALADFDGKGNTDVIVALGPKYTAANRARNYKAVGAEEIEWYLPAAGELGYIMPRLNKIQAALAKVNANELKVDAYSSYYPAYWGSTEITYSFAVGQINAIQLQLSDGRIFGAYKDESYGGYLTRPFALLP